MTTTTAVKMPGTPPAWVNSVMRALLRTPGLRRLLGRTFAVITVTGARTGRRYSTPVQYLRFGPDYVVLSQQGRKWWRNIRTRPQVELLVRGRTVRGRAEVADPDSAPALLRTCLQQEPRVAKFYRVEVGTGAAVDPAGIEQLLERVVVIRISPDPVS